jgi:methylated-DNA-[protein]-cysteine S-methyltransferase
MLYTYGFIEPVPYFPLWIECLDEAVARVSFEEPPTGLVRARDDGHPLVRRASEQLREYFAGERRRFDLPLELEGTPFQLRVWNALLEIPYGETRSYGQLARELGVPGAARAVGAANGANPVAIIVPCHRVIAAGGALHGYGGGLDRKKFLLELESGASMRLINSFA